MALLAQLQRQAVCSTSWFRSAVVSRKPRVESVPCNVTRIRCDALHDTCEVPRTVTRNGDFVSDEVSNSDSAKSPSSMKDRVPSAVRAVIVEPMPLVSVICSSSVAFRLPCSATTASPAYVPLTVPTLPSDALSVRVNDLFTSRNVLTARLVASGAAGPLTGETSLGSCSTTDGVIGVVAPLQPGRVNARELTVTKHGSVTNEEGNQAFIGARMSNNVALHTPRHGAGNMAIWCAT